MDTPTIIATGLGAAEGPVWCTDGSLVVTSVDQGALYRVRPEGGAPTLVARTGGGANGATPAAGGGFIVTQNGGFDFRILGLDVPAPDVVESGLQAVSPAGEVTYLARGGFAAPNDLSAAADGTLYFTDPPKFPYDPEARAGRVWSLRRGGTPQVVGTGFAFCNGIGVAPDGAVLVIEGPGLVRLRGDGGFDWVVERLAEQGGGDGFCFDTAGRVYICTSSGSCVRVYEGTALVEMISIPFTAASSAAEPRAQFVTNCCFGGDGMRTLFVTTGYPGQVVAVGGMPTAGAAVHAF